MDVGGRPSGHRRGCQADAPARPMGISIRQLGKLGFRILLGSRDQARGQEATATLTTENIHAKAITLDVTDPDTIQSAAQQIDDQYGSLDVLINDAGVSLDGGAPPDLEEEHI